MTLTFAQVGSLPQYVVGSQRRTVTDVTLDTSYPVAGEVVNASDLRLGYLDTVTGNVQTTATTTVNTAEVAFDVSAGNTAGLLKLVDETPALVADNSNMNGMVVRLEAYGY